MLPSFRKTLKLQQQLSASIAGLDRATFLYLASEVSREGKGNGIGVVEGTCYDGRNAPANNIVEPHVPEIDVPHFGQHPVDVELLHKHPCKGAHVEIMQEDGNHGAHKLQKRKCSTIRVTFLNHNPVSHRQNKYTAINEVSQFQKSCSCCENFIYLFCLNYVACSVSGSALPYQPIMLVVAGLALHILWLISLCICCRREDFGYSD